VADLGWFVKAVDLAGTLKAEPSFFRLPCSPSTAQPSRSVAAMADADALLCRQGYGCFVGAKHA